MKALKNKKVRILIWIALTPTILFTLLMVSLYIPPIQNLIRKEVSAIASKQSGMQITMDRIDLSFPLNIVVSGLKVVKDTDTLLNVGNVDVEVSALSLLKGKVNIKSVSVSKLLVNTANLIEGMQVRGELMRFSVDADEIDVLGEKADINSIDIRNVDFTVTIDSIVSKEDTTTTKINWLVSIDDIDLSNIKLKLEMPNDSIKGVVRLNKTNLENIEVDLPNEKYLLKRFLIEKSELKYIKGREEIKGGFDPNNIYLKDILIDLESLMYAGKNTNAVIRSVYMMEENSGLGIFSMSGNAFSNDSVISVPNINLKTLSSEFNLSLETDWKALELNPNSKLKMNVFANLSKSDLEQAYDVPKAIREEYAGNSIKMRTDIDGTLGRIKLKDLSLELHKAFSAKASGFLIDILDEKRRSGNFKLAVNTEDMKFISKVASGKDVNSVVIPDSIVANGEMSLNGSNVSSDIVLNSLPINVSFESKVNITDESYILSLKLDNAYISKVLTNIPLYNIAASAKISGRGFDVKSRKTKSDIDFVIKDIHYDKYKVDSLQFIAKIEDGLAKAHLSTNNKLIGIDAKADYNLTAKEYIANLDANISNLDLKELGLIDKPLGKEFTYSIIANLSKEQVKASLNSGDLSVSLLSKPNANVLISESQKLMTMIEKQIIRRELDNKLIMQSLPNISVSIKSGKENPLSYILKQKDISFNSADMTFGAEKDKGLFGNVGVNRIMIDTLVIDNVDFVLAQDTAQIKYMLKVENDKSNPQYSFATTIDGYIANKDAQMNFELKDRERETGVLLGINAKPFKNERTEGFLFKITPEEPVIAFRKFSFNEKNNWVYLHKNMRVYASIDMRTEDNTGIRISSSNNDSVSLQNMNVELKKLQLKEISSAIPYIPYITGELSAEAHYIQTKDKLQLSADVNVYDMTYEKQEVGNISLGTTWLPANDGKQYLSTYLTYNDSEVLLADGKLMPSKTKKDSIEVNSVMTSFPLHIANLFIPKKLVSLKGEMNGELNVEGMLDSPKMNGYLTLDSVYITSQQYGASFRFDDSKVPIKNSQILFDKYSIYSVNNNPFVIDGLIDFKELAMPLLNINMKAVNYTILDAPKTKESLVYGKVMADFSSTVKGRLDNLSMRGNINLLGNTDVSYIYTDSPLTVQDRLGGLVNFTSFADTVSTNKKKTNYVSLGGLDMLMTVHIDPSVRMKVDLDASSDNRVELEGGGNLSLKYSPQGDMLLSGRYTLSGGLMKYSLPVIAAKKFAIDNGSYLEWNGKITDPFINFKATDRIRASVTDKESGSSRNVDFDVSIIVKNKLNNLTFAFDVAAPEDTQIQNELTAMGEVERGKQALYIMITKSYLGRGPIGGGGGKGMPDMGSALSSVLSGQINSLLGNIKNASLSVGVENHEESGGAGKRTDYSFRYSQRLFDNRFQIVIGGKVSTGANANNNAQSFIDNISLEYRLDRTGTRYVRMFYDKNYESIIDEEIIETGVGVVLRKKVDKLSELFIFKRKKK